MDRGAWWSTVHRVSESDTTWRMNNSDKILREDLTFQKETTIFLAPTHPEVSREGLESSTFSVPQAYSQDLKVSSKALL